MRQARLFLFFLAIYGGLLCSLMGPSQVAYAFHFPWDQGHDTFKPAAPPPDPLPCKGDDCDPCKKGNSPVAFDTGGYSMREVDLFVSGLGFSLEIVRAYNSQDERSGLFGNGWIFNYDVRLIEVTDGLGEGVIVREPNGQRDRFTKQPDGTFSPRAGLFDKLTRQSDGSWRLTRESGAVLEFDPIGYLVSIADADGNRTALDYNELRFLETVTDATDRILTFTQAPNGKVSTITDPAGRIIEYEYDTAGNLVSVTRPDGAITNYTYDTGDRLVGIISPKGDLIVSISYDGLNRVTRWESIDGDFRYLYDSLAQVRRVNNDTGATTTFVVDPVSGRWTQQTDALGNTLTRTYDENGKLVSATDKRGNEINRTYDEQGRLTSISNETGATRILSYNEDGDLASVTLPNGAVEAYEYDEQGRLIRIREAVGTPLERSTSFTYYQNGLLATETDPNGNTTSYEYNEYGRTNRIVDPLGNATSFTYDIAGNMLTETDANGNTTKSTYDAAGRLLAEVDPLGFVTGYSYDVNGNLVELTDANGSKTTFAYDDFDRLTAVTDALGSTAMITYDAGGQVSTVTDANGMQSSLSYDPLGRLTQVTAPSYAETYSYDPNNNLTGFSNSVVLLDASYDSIGRVASFTNETLQKTLSYGYDAAEGRHLASVGLRGSLVDPEGGTTTYNYDLLGRLTSITNPRGETTSYSYDAGDRVVNMTLPNGIVESYVYNAASNLTSVMTTASDGEVLFRVAYTYDAVGNCISKTDQNGTVTTYSYDARNRLIREDIGGNVITYTYDGVENRLTRTDASGTTTYSYDTANRLSSRNGPTGTTSYAYDDNGNLISNTSPAGTTTYSYDFRNRLTNVGFPDGTTNTFEYGLGWQRFSKTDSSGTRRYLWDDVNVLAEYDESGTRVVAYTHGDPADSRVDDVLSQIIDGTGESLFYLKDGLGSTVAVVDDAENVAGNFTYEAFGTLRSADGPQADSVPYLFTGRRYDSDAEMFYYRQRYYDPALGRFLSRDPMGKIDGPNLYAYVLNNPVNAIDPSGMALTFTGCSAVQKLKLRAAINDVKNTVNNPPYKCFIGKDLGKCLIRKTNDLEIRCGGGNCTSNPNLRGETPTPGTWVRLCNRTINGTQSRLNAVVFHEMTHSCRASENTAEGCENRCYEGRNATKPTAGESCDDCK